MAWTDDPVRDFIAYDRECQRRLSRYPKCDCCGEYITEETFYYIEKQKVCEECLDLHYRRDTDDYIQEDDE